MNARFSVLGVLLGSALGLAAAETRVETLELRETLQATWAVPRANEAAGGGPLRVGHAGFARGFGTAGGSRLELELDGRAGRFRASTGVDDSASPLATACFLLVGDGRVLHRGPWQQAGGRPVSVDVSVAGIRRLALVVEVRGEPYARADWLEPVVEHEGAAPRAVPPVFERGLVTPAAPQPEPRFAATRIAGVRPGRPWLWRVGVIAAEPATVTVDGLPPGLTFNPATRVISGQAPAAPGDYLLRFRAATAGGRAEQAFHLVVGDTFALTPPLGWCSWYCMSGKVSAAWVRDAADALVRTGLADHGWTQVNIDDFWMTRPTPDDPRFARLRALEQAGRVPSYYKAVLDDPEFRGEARDARGRIRPNARFPDMAGLVDFLHARGLRAGIYSSPGVLTCGGCTGSFGHETEDAAQFAEWGFDYLKYDWCSYSLETPTLDRADWQAPFARMGAALRAQPRDLVYNLCEYGRAEVWEWGAAVGAQSWRVAEDVVDTWGSISAAGFHVEACDAATGPGRWNDLDMLMLGRIGWNRRLHDVRLAPDEQRTQLALWSLRGAPLLLAGDPAALDDFTLSLLGNDEVLAVNQDPAARPARRVVLSPTLEAWIRPLADGAVAVGIFNRDEEAADVTVPWARLGLAAPARVRDLWRHAAAAGGPNWTGTVPRHGVEFIRLDPISP